MHGGGRGRDGKGNLSLSSATCRSNRVYEQDLQRLIKTAERFGLTPSKGLVERKALDEDLPKTERKRKWSTNPTYAGTMYVRSLENPEEYCAFVDVKEKTLLFRFAVAVAAFCRRRRLHNLTR